MPNDNEPRRIIEEVGPVVKRGILQSFADPAGTLYAADTPLRAMNAFLEDNEPNLRLATVELARPKVTRGSATVQRSLEQRLNGLPILGAEVRIVADEQRSAVLSATNELDYRTAGAPEPSEAMPWRSAEPTVVQLFERYFDTVEVRAVKLAYLRFTERPDNILGSSRDRAPDWMNTGPDPDGRLHLVHDALVVTAGPIEGARVVVDAVSGKILFIEVLSKSVSAKLYAYHPDPVTSSNDGALSGSSTKAKLNKQRKEVTSEIAGKSGGKYALKGTWVECKDIEAPTFAQPSESTASFKYDATDRKFLSANAYFWLDDFIRYLRGLGVKKFNKDVKKIDVDAQADGGKDNSWWRSYTTPPQIVHGEGGAPDAADMAVILHEFTHGICYFLGRPKIAYQHSFCDALPVIYRDRFNPKGHRRTETFPFDNNKTDSWSKDRTLSRKEKFDAANFSTLNNDIRASMLGTAFWQCFMGIGGDSKHTSVRKKAGDDMLRNLMEAVLLAPSSGDWSKASAKTIADKTITADTALTGGLYSKVFYDAYVDRGLYKKREVDVYIRDSAGDTGAHPSPHQHWSSPDIWVRNKSKASGDDPSKGHQVPIVNKKNYMYVRVHNRGTKGAKNFKVDAYHCDPGTGMVWPSDFTSMGTLPVTGTVSAGGSKVVGPFEWTPKKKGHECLLAIARGADDPAIDEILKKKNKKVAHGRLVRFDNNVGQRNVSPKLTVPGGKSKTSFDMHGASQASTNRMELDASSLPDDTVIEVRILRRIAEAAATLEGFRVIEQSALWTTLRMTAGQGSVEGFPLRPHDRVGVDVTVDVSVNAVAGKTYPIVATQYQDDELAGRVTVEVTAVKESEDYVYGNPRSLELHTVKCPFWPKISQANKVPFLNIEDGTARGYNGCRFCLPDQDTG